MADKKSAKPVKAKIVKKKSTMRESAAKTRASAGKTKRVRKAAQAATKSGSALGRILTAEYHVLPRKSEESFFHKSRKITPVYFRNSAKEVSMVTWPARKETWRLVFAVFLFAITMGTLIAVLDYGLEKILREVIL